MTVKDIIDDAMVLCNHATTVTATRVRFLRYINQWHRRILTKPGFTRLLRDSERTLTTVSGQAVYGLTVPMGRLNGIYDPTNKLPLDARDLQWLRTIDSGLTANGTPQIYIPRGWAPVERQPSTPTSLWGLSTSGGDTPNLTYEYVLSDGSRRSGMIVVGSGGVAVQLGGATDVVEVTRLWLNEHVSPTSIITVRTGSSFGPAIATFYPPLTSNRYFQVQLWPTPAQALTYVLDYTREIVDLAEGEEPMLPPDFHFILSLGAQAEEFRKFDDDRWISIRSDIDDALRSLNRWVWDLPDLGTHDRVGPGSVGFSRLGGMFPAGS